MWEKPYVGTKQNFLQPYKSDAETSTPEFDSARQFNNYTTLADDTSEALPDIDTHPRELAPILVESSSEDSE